MRGRATSWRNLTNSSPLGRRFFIDYRSNRPKPLKQHKNEDGDVFYTLQKWGEGRGAPSPHSRDAQTTFLISNLLLDLDAYEVDGVRPYNNQDEEQHNEHFKTTGRRGGVTENMRELVKTLNQSRWNAEKLVLHPAHPKRITDSDITSLALRAPVKVGVGPVYTPSKSDHTSASYEGERGSGEAEEKYDIRTLNNVHPRPDESASAASSSLRKTMPSGAPQSNPELKRILKLGDSTLRQSGFTEEVRQANGIPESATESDEQLIRWMLLRQHNSAFVADKTGSPQATDIAAAISNVQEKEGARVVEPENIASIRRIVFHALNSGSKLMGSEAHSGRKENVAMQIQESIRGVLEVNPKKKHLCFETLTFTNNLSSRPEIQGNHDLAFAILSLRLQATASLGYVKLMATYLDQGVQSQALRSDGTALKELRATVLSLEVNVKSMKELESAENRELLFRILTGYGKTGPAPGDSIRKLILHGDIWQEGEFQKRRLSVFMSYITLLGRIGGVRSLWSEWRIAQKFVAGAKREEAKTRDAARKLVTEGFRLALSHDQRQKGLSAAIKDGGFENSALLDCDMIAQKSEALSSKGHSWDDLTGEQFEKMMNLPFSKWSEEVAR